jgi:mRNA-degrading endonuclease RelE of RelBE toxin-antitoxin system
LGGEANKANPCGSNFSIIPVGDIKKLKGFTVAYRLRVGDWRILFDMGADITITNILPRGEAYKK